MSDRSLSLSVGDLLTLDVEEINNLGAGVAHYEGLVVFVKGAVSGDTVRAKVIKIAKSFAVARFEEIVTPSPYRENSDTACHEPNACGGCVWRGVTYEHELLMKQKYVEAAFFKAGLKARVMPTLTDGKVYRYRNKAQYPVASTKSGLRAGFYAQKTHNIIPIGDCLISNEKFAPIVDFVCRFAEKNGVSAYDEKSGKGLLRHIYLRSADATGELMLCLVINGKSLPNEAGLVAEIGERFPNITSIFLNFNRKNTNVVLGDEYRLLFGRPYIEDSLCGLNFRIAPEAFYQVNHDSAELLYSKAAELAELDGRATLVDLYCGTGTIGLSMAAHAERVFGVDIVEESINCARENAELNGITNAHFLCADAGDAESIAACLERENIKLSEATVIIDPPRKGSTPELISLLARENTPRVVYVSCNPDTLARDCALFTQLGYKMSEVYPVNMFPRTGHVETVTLLSRKIDVHKMKLNSTPFEMIKSGEKTIELRLYDEKRQQVKVGDMIVFTNITTGEIFNTTVVKLHRFDTFDDLYKSLPLLKCGYTTESIEKATPTDMEQYYSVEEQNKYGVVGIELCRPKEITDESVVCLTKK